MCGAQRVPIPGRSVKVQMTACCGKTDGRLTPHAALTGYSAVDQNETANDTRSLGEGPHPDELLRREHDEQHNSKLRDNPVRESAVYACSRCDGAGLSDPYRWSAGRRSPLSDLYRVLGLRLCSDAKSPLSIAPELAALAEGVAIHLDQFLYQLSSVEFFRRQASAGRFPEPHL